ncbi:unnamed protein product [Trichobilharzia regenti]|nr:unnamed protein product [Trichobilharzia regenti]
MVLPKNTLENQAFGRFLIYRPGSVRFVALRQAALRSQIIMILIGLVVIFIFVGLIGFVIWRRFIRRQKSYQAKLHQKYAEHENRVIRIFKEVNPYSSFPLSIDTDILFRPSSDLCTPSSSIPPHPLLSPFTVNIRAHDDAAKAISLFHILLCNRQFLYLLIHLIEKDEHIMAKDKSRIASLLSIALQPKMDYLTRSAGLFSFLVNLYINLLILNSNNIIIIIIVCFISKQYL